VSVTFEVAKPTGKIVIDVDAMAKRAAAFVPGLVLRRVDDGRDIFDRPFAPYSGSYMHALTEGGESTAVDLRLTGGLLNSVKLRETRQVSDGVELIFGPDTGTSPAVSLAGGRAKRTGGRGQPHNVVGYWIHHGTPRMPARPWLGLSPRDMETLARALAAVRRFAEVRGA
jgi:hypothetical protein